MQRYCFFLNYQNLFAFFAIFLNFGLVKKCRLIFVKLLQYSTHQGFTNQFGAVLYAIFIAIFVQHVHFAIVKQDSYFVLARCSLGSVCRHSIAQNCMAVFIPKLTMARPTLLIYVWASTISSTGILICVPPA